MPKNTEYVVYAYTMVMGGIAIYAAYVFFTLKSFITRLKRIQTDHSDEV